MEYDLLTHGKNLDDLGTRRLSWRDLWVIVRQAPRGSALDRASNPDEWQWGLLEHLQAASFDALRVANWQRGQAKTADFPKPTVRPGVEPDGKTFGRDALPMDEMTKFLGWDKTESAEV